MPIHLESVRRVLYPGEYLRVGEKVPPLWSDDKEQGEKNKEGIEKSGWRKNDHASSSQEKVEEAVSRCLGVMLLQIIWGMNKLKV